MTYKELQLILTF